MQISIHEYNEAMGLAHAAGVNAAVAELDAVLAAELPGALKTAFESGKASAKAAPTRPTYSSSRRSGRPAGDKPTLRPAA